MHIVVAGASGATGRLLVRDAISARHRVTALVRGGTRCDLQGADMLVADPVVDAELTLPSDVDAVISCLGMRPDQPDVPVCAPGTKNLIAAMLRADISRLVVTSAVPAHTSGPGEPLWFRVVRTLVRRRTPQIYDDIEAMEQLMHETGDDIAWTVLRPGYLTDGGPTEYGLLPERNATTSASRRDLAHALLTIAQDTDSSGRSFGLRSGRGRTAGARR